MRQKQKQRQANRHRQRTVVRQGADESTASMRQHRPDYVLAVICLALLAIGLVVVYAISPGLAAQAPQLSEGHFIQRQLLAIVLAIVTFLVVARLRMDFWFRITPLLIVATLGALLATQFISGDGVNAARWIHIGGLSFQSVELLKFALVIWLAGFLADRAKEGEINNLRATLRPIGIVLALSGVFVVVLQSDLGSMGVVAAIIGVMLFLAGLSMRWFGLGMLSVVVIGALFIVASPYRQERVTTFLNPQSDCLAEGYQACQALIAIGSGGMFGKGIDRSAQAYGYLPEAANDSIFAVYAEMFGFVGVAVLMLLFVALFSRLYRIVERAPTLRMQLMAAGVLAWLSTQAFINIMAMLGLFPLKGITLPFISYGGTSIVFVTAGVALLFNISRYMRYRPRSLDATDKQQKTYNESRGAYEDTRQRRGNRRPHYAYSIRRS